MTDPSEPPEFDDLVLLGRALDYFEPVPVELGETSARSAYLLNRSDDVVAQVAADTAFDDMDLVAARGQNVERRMTFVGEGREVVIFFGLIPGTIMGRVVPPEAANMQVDTTDHTKPIDVDDAGRFRVDRVPKQFRLVWNGIAGEPSRRVSTPFIFV